MEIPHISLQDITTTKSNCDMIPICIVYSKPEPSTKAALKSLQNTANSKQLTHLNNDPYDYFIDGVRLFSINNHIIAYGTLEEDDLTE